MAQDFLDATAKLCLSRAALKSARARVQDGYEAETRAPPKLLHGMVVAPWPCERGGLRRTGFSSEAGPTLRRIIWKRSLSAATRSSPVIDEEGSVYIGSESGKVHAFLQDGQTKWVFDTGAPVVATPSLGNPVLSDATLFVTNFGGRLSAISSTFGTNRWGLV